MTKEQEENYRKRLTDLPAIGNGDSAKPIDGVKPSDNDWLKKFAEQEGIKYKRVEDQSSSTSSS